MIRIAVVDDQKEMCAMVCDYIRQAFEEEGNIEIDTFFSAESFLEKIDNSLSFML